MQVCSINLLFAGLIEVEEKEQVTETYADNILALQTSKIIESQINNLLD
jgi:hypothetical protein